MASQRQNYPKGGGAGSVEWANGVCGATSKECAGFLRDETLHDVFAGAERDRSEPCHEQRVCGKTDRF
jgi:hypothetical protein